MQRRPLPDDLAIRPRIVDLVGRDAGEMIGRDVADAVAAGLDRMHLDGCETGQHVRHVFQRGPVVLQVLSCREVAVVAVVLAGQMREHAQLTRRQQAIGNRHAQHGRMGLDIEPVAQSQRPELVFGERALEEASGLVAELVNALCDDGRVNVVVAVHGTGTLREWPVKHRPGTVIFTCRRVICHPVVGAPARAPRRLDAHPVVCSP